MKKTNILFCSFPDYAGNAKSLYKYMKKNYDSKQNLVWAVSNAELSEKLQKQGIKTVVIGTAEYTDYLNNVDVFFTTHANLIGDKEKTKNAIYVELWHGIGPKPVGYLSKNMPDSDLKWCSEASNIIDYMIVSSEFWKVVFAAQFNLNVNKIKSLGLPILDEIVTSPGKENLKKILNTDLNKYKKIIMYLPTFRKGCGRELSVNYNDDTVFNIKDYTDKKLIQFLKQNNYLLVVKRHPSEERNYNIIENDYIKNIDTQLLTDNLLNINSILNAADILITDYSSIGTEYLFLDRPLIYISSDLKEYQEERGIILDDYDFWTEGFSCNTFEGLKNQILSCETTRVSKNRKLFFGTLKDGGCKEICEYFFSSNGNIKKEVLEDIENRKNCEKNEQLHIQNKKKKNNIFLIEKMNKMLKKVSSKIFNCLRMIKKKIIK